MEDHINLQKSSKIYGVTKMGATKKDINLILRYQKQGYDEHFVQDEIGVHFMVVRTFMEHNALKDEPNGNKNVPVFTSSDPQPTIETKFLYDRIAELEKAGAPKQEENAETEAEKPKVKPKKSKAA